MAGLHINVIAVGKLKEDYWVAACAEYAKRLGRYAQLVSHEVPDRPARTDGASARAQTAIETALRVEAVDLRQRLGQRRELRTGQRLGEQPTSTYTVILDSSGRQFTSEQLAAKLRDLQNQGTSTLNFVIGGSWGIATDLKSDADLLLSFGPITLPHNLARVVLLEQLYRAYRIINGEPYHK
ncbi:MAG: 23S rRNA (pseudouridine(1915)-N(3))-methyltransferase RlmH [Coriobacteriales bacterium]|jgi:23S rRNA (pseudouridine1915-N3)-methyltransferase|nr:23S rRNA (pseudouridine(1915)-N(3))-methyltransferase RlmH [Coriobacteriales bacterium]